MVEEYVELFVIYWYVLRNCTLVIKSSISISSSMGMNAHAAITIFVLVHQ